MNTARLSRFFPLLLLLGLLACSLRQGRTAPIKIMPLGDSITFGTRSSDESGYRKPLYLKLVAEGLSVQMVGSQHNGNFAQPANEGHPGWTTDQLSGHIEEWLKASQPDIVLLQIGTNDVFQKLPDREAALTKLLDQIFTVSPRVKVAVSTVTPTFEPRMTVFNSFVPGVLQRERALGRSIVLVDEYHAGIGLSDTADAIHPTDAGYAKMADVWLPAVKALLNGETKPSAPLHLGATAGPGIVTLHWDTAFGADSYSIGRAEKSGGPYRTLAQNIAGNFYYTDTTAKNGKAGFYIVKARNAVGEGAASNEASATAQENLGLAINCGGSATGAFMDDADWKGGTVGVWGFYDTMKLEGAPSPAPQDVYKTQRTGNFSYDIPGLKPKSRYSVRLHFCDYESDAAGKRVFNVALNGQRVLSNFDIFASAGGRWKAMVKEFSVRPDPNGHITLVLSSVIGDASLCGLEVLPPSFVASVPPSPLVSAGLLAEYRFDEGSGALLKGYGADGKNAPALDGPIDGGYAPTWKPEGLFFKGSIVTAARGLHLMDEAKTVLVVADVAPSTDVGAGAAILLGTHSGSYKEVGVASDGRVGLLNGSESWYGGSVGGGGGIMPVIREQGALAVTIAFADRGTNGGKLWYGSEPQQYYVSRATPVDYQGAGDVVFGMGLGLGTNGKIYYAALWDRALTDAEVMQNYAHVNQILTARGVKLGDTISATKPLLVFMGDSITAGAGAGYGRSWPDQVGQSMNGDYRNTNAGYGGICVSNVNGGGTGYNSFGPEEIDPVFGLYHGRGNVAVISLGVNDESANISAPLLVAALQTRVNQVRAAGALKVAMATLTPRSNGNETVRLAVNDAIRGGKITGVDVVLDFAQDPNMGSFSNTTEGKHLYYGDGVHPTQAGHDILAHIAEAGLKSIGIPGR